MNTHTDNHSRLARILEVLVALGGVLILLPAFGLAALAILWEDGTPVFFRQVRVGLNGKLFRIWKFRTMTAGISGTGITVAGDHRITHVGAALRRWKIDELPQLLNVLAAEMSLVGPRPEVPQYVNTEAPIWRDILSVRPGITDLATLFYRDEENRLSKSADHERYYRETILPVKLQISLKYLQVKSFRGDLKLLLLSIFSAISGRAIQLQPRSLIENRSV